MGNQTTNRLESFHGKVKAYLHSNMTLSNCVDELLHFDRRKEIQSSHEVIIASVKTRYRYGEDSEITDAIQSIATPFAADIILHELNEARKIEATIANKDTSSHFTVTVGDVSYNVATTESCSCECTCFMSQLLPCRHILTCLLQEETPFQTSWIPERWTREYNNNRTIVSGQVINVKTVTNGPKMTRREKFCEMNRLLRDIADMSADLGHHNFCSRFHFIVDLHKAWSQSKLVSLVVESQGYGSAEAPGHDNRDTAPRNTNVTAERELRHNGHNNSDVIDSAGMVPCINGKDDGDDSTHDIDMTERDMSQTLCSTDMTVRGDTEPTESDFADIADTAERDNSDSASRLHQSAIAEDATRCCDMESAQTTEKTNVTSHEDAQSTGSVNIEMTGSNDGLARENGQPDEGEGRIDRSRTPLRKVRFKLSKPALSKGRPKGDRRSAIGTPNKRPRTAVTGRSRNKRRRIEFAAPATESVTTEYQLMHSHIENMSAADLDTIIQGCTSVSCKWPRDYISAVYTHIHIHADLCAHLL